MGKREKYKKHELTEEEPPAKPFSAGPAYFGNPKVILSVIPLLVVAAAIAVTVALDYTGYIDIENIIDFPLEIKEHAIRNKPYVFDFAPKLIPMLNPEWNGLRNGYTFYLGPNTGFPPIGLILSPDGFLKGTPTGMGKTFVVCVRDVAENTKCIKVHLTVDEEQEQPYVPPNSNCPATSHETSTPCGSNQTGGASVGGVYVSMDCPCPSDTVDYGAIVVAEDVQYKTCICKK
jgi:hypothetical protein